METITLGLDIGQYSIKGVRPKSRRFGLGNGSFDYFDKQVSREQESDPFLLLSPMQEFGLKQLVAEGKITPSDMIAVSLPGHLVSIREITLPFTNPQKIRKTIYFEAEGQLPFNFDEVIVDYTTLLTTPLSTRLLVFAVPKLILNGYLEKLQAIGIDPVIVSVDMIALHHLIAGNNGLQIKGCLVMDLGATKTILCGINEGRLGWARTTPTGTDLFVDILKEALNLSWTDAEHLMATLDHSGEMQDQATEVLSNGLGPWLTDIEVSLTQAGIPLSTPLRLCGGAQIGLGKFLSKVLHREIVLHRNPLNHPIATGRLSCCFAQATGLAILPLDTVNFRREEFIHPRKKEEHRWPSVASFIMVGLLLLGLVWADAYLHSLKKERDLQRLKDRIKIDFQAIFPDAGHIVNEVKQTEIAITHIRKETDFLGIGIDSPLQILKGVTDAIPKKVKIYITEFNLEREKVQIEAQTTSFDSVDQIRRALMGVESFNQVTVGDANVTEDRSRINFRVQISLKTAKHPINKE